MKQIAAVLVRHIIKDSLREDSEVVHVVDIVDVRRLKPRPKGSYRAAIAEAPIRITDGLCFLWLSNTGYVKACKLFP